MRVLHVGPLPPPYGGVEVLLDLLLQSQQNRKEYTIDCLNTSRGVNYRRYRTAQFSLDGLTRRILLAWRLVRKLQQFRPDIVHYQVGRADWSFVSDALNLSIIWICGSKLVVHLHNAPEQSLAQNQSVFPGRNRITQFFWRAVMQRIHCLIVLSEKYRQAFSQFISSNKIFVVPDTCSDDLLRIDRTSIDQIRSQGVFTIVFLGRLTQEKGVSDLLQAAYMLGQHGHVFKLWLCGTALTSVAEMELKQLVERLGLGDKVVFAGAVGTDKKYTLLQNADVVVLPSYSESFGMALLEGMAASLPVIGTRVGCIDEIIVENETGLIYSPGDINALEEALSYLAMNPQTRQQMGSAGRARFRRLYSRSYVVELIGTIYRDIGRL